MDLAIRFDEPTDEEKQIYPALKKKVKTLALKYLLSKIKSKGKEIVLRKNLQCQIYLLPNKVLTIQEQRAIFSFRTRMNILKKRRQINIVITLFFPISL